MEPAQHEIQRLTGEIDNIRAKIDVLLDQWQQCSDPALAAKLLQRVGMLEQEKKGLLDSRTDLQVRLTAAAAVQPGAAPAGASSLDREMRRLRKTLAMQMLHLRTPAKPPSSSRGESASQALSAYIPLSLTTLGLALCNATGRVWTRPSVKAAHLYQLRWPRERATLAQYGVPDVNDPRNMLILHKRVEAMYDEMRITFFPADNPDNYMVKVLDPTLKEDQTNCIATVSGPEFNMDLPLLIRHAQQALSAGSSAGQHPALQGSTAQPAADESAEQAGAQQGAGTQPAQQGGAEQAATDQAKKAAAAELLLQQLPKGAPILWSGLDGQLLVFATEARPAATLMYALACRAVAEAEDMSWIEQGSVQVPCPSWLAVSGKVGFGKFLQDAMAVISSSDGDGGAETGITGDSKAETVDDCSISSETVDDCSI